jgi:general secretion pathway protein I
LKPPKQVGRGQSNGFTLIEVMAALIIVSLGMLAVITAVSQTASNSAYLREKSVAHWVAMNRVTELRLAPQSPATGDTSGEVEMAGKRWRWSAQVSQTNISTMRRIDVSVAPLTDAKSLLDEDSHYATITGFYGEKIAQPGTVFAQFDAPPPPPAGQQNNPGQPTPTPPPKVPLPSTDGTIR